MHHDDAVDKHYDAGLEAIDDGYWDDVFRETSYFEAYEDPIDSISGDRGLEVGEFDVIFINYEDKVALYKEIKTSYSDTSYAHDQIERAQDHFDEHGWDILGTIVVE